jgi:Domain of unknown function (DUF7014)/AbiJ N-terminal domain 4
MPVFDIYSRRKRRAEQGEPDVYQYHQVPSELRIQVRHILDAALGSYTPNYATDEMQSHNKFLWSLHVQLLKETARRRLWVDQAVVRRRVSPANDPKADIIDAVQYGLSSVENWLDVVELCFWAIQNGLATLSDRERTMRGIEQHADDAIKELNIRFRHAGFGYQFEGGQIVRVDSQLLHSEVVKPALALLTDPRFEGAQQEFLSAHAHHRAGEHEDAIVDANRAFESTLKAICDIMKWECSKGARASDLVKIIRSKGLLPDYLDQSFDQLIATLQSGLPKVRNEAGGHGQGTIPRVTPSYIAGYALHLAAANIVLLVEALKATKA